MQLLIALLILFIVFFVWILIDTNIIERKEYEVKSNKIPKEFDGYKICFVTDLHNKTRNKNIVDRCIKKVNKEEADIIVLGGDYIFRSIFKYTKEKKENNLKKSHGEEYKVLNAWEKISKFKAKDNVYTILGNHDYWEEKSFTLSCIEKAGFKSMDNNAYWIEKKGARIRIGGTSDISEDMSDITKTTDEVTNEYTILACHSPVILTLPKDGMDKVDLLLAGHLHGGQVNFFGKYTPLINKRWRGNIIKGMDVINNVRVIISSGIGTSLLPIRFCARPDYSVITLRSEDKDD